MSGRPPFAPRIVGTREYVQALYRPGDHVAIVVRDAAARRATQRIVRARALLRPRFEAWLRRQDQRGSDVFLGMNPVKEGSRSRTKEQIREIRHAYLDLDEGGDRALEAIRFSSEVPRPNFVLDTSPGRHQVVWRVRGLDLSRAETLLRALAARFGGDPAATDVARVLRLPGFTNHKYAQPFVVQARFEAEETYTPRDFRIPEDAPEWPRPFEGAGTTRKMAAGHRSQSEADWAYARRALARGEAPEEIARRIADYRAGEKSDPAVYALRTVSKAAESLRMG